MAVRATFWFRQDGKCVFWLVKPTGVKDTFEVLSF